MKKSSFWNGLSPNKNGPKDNEMSIVFSQNRKREVDLNYVVEICFCKFSDRFSFTNLMGNFYNQRPSVFIVFPVRTEDVNLSFEVDRF